MTNARRGRGSGPSERPAKEWIQLGVAVITAIATLGALYFTSRSLDFTADANSATKRQIEIADQGQKTDRYIRATEQLGSDKLDVRLGAVYSLARLMRDSAEDVPTIVEVLSAFVREHAPRAQPATPRLAVQPGCPERTDPPTGRPAVDVQAAVGVIGRRPAGPKNLPEPRINLEGADLTGADLVGLDLRKASLVGANLSGANLYNAQLQESLLSTAVLRHAKLGRAHLRRADFERADLTEASLERADAVTTHFKEAAFSRARMSEADLSQANFALTNLCMASLATVKLRGTSFSSANLTRAYVSGAEFDGTRLDDADLTGVESLTREQLAKASYDPNTKLPAGFP